PLQHLVFDTLTGEVDPARIDGKVSEQGVSTIWALELYRKDLVEARRQVAEGLWARWQTISKADVTLRKRLIVTEMTQFRDICADNAPFAGMCRQLLWHWSQAERILQTKNWRGFRAELGKWNGGMQYQTGFK